MLFLRQLAVSCKSASQYESSNNLNNNIGKLDLGKFVHIQCSFMSTPYIYIYIYTHIYTYAYISTAEPHLVLNCFQLNMYTTMIMI